MRFTVGTINLQEIDDKRLYVYEDGCFLLELPSDYKETGFSICDALNQTVREKINPRAVKAMRDALEEAYSLLIKEKKKAVLRDGATFEQAEKHAQNHPDLKAIKEAIELARKPYEPLEVIRKDYGNNKKFRAYPF